MALQAEKKLVEQQQKISKTLKVSFMLRKAHSRMDIVTTLRAKLNIQNKYQHKSASSDLTNLNRVL